MVWGVSNSHSGANEALLRDAGFSVVRAEELNGFMRFRQLR